MTLGASMEKEIRDQPAALGANADRYHDELAECLRGQSFEMILLVARGSSDNASLYARYLLEIHLGIPVSLAAPSVITQYGASMRYPKCLAIGVSQSGAAPDVSEVLSVLRDRGHKTLAITNTSGSRVEEAAEYGLQLGLGPEVSVAATKTYSASLLAFYQLARALGAALPDPSNELPTYAWVEQALTAARASLGPVLRWPVLFALGRGYGFCTAQEQALKLMECALLPCKAYSTADFEHGPRALAGHGSAAVVYGQAPAGLADQGCVVLGAPYVPEGPLRPIFEVFFAQWLALEAARARGLDPDRPAYIHKVTETL